MLLAFLAGACVFEAGGSSGERAGRFAAWISRISRGDDARAAWIVLASGSL